MEIPGSIKKEVEFLKVFTKNSCGISISRSWFLALEFSPRGFTQFSRIPRGESLFSKVKVTNIKIAVGFKYIHPEPNLLLPCLDFLWSEIAQYS